MDSPTSKSSSQDAQHRHDAEALPIIDVAPLLSDKPSEESLRNTVQAIREACCNWGFFYITNHGVSVTLQQQIESLSKQFFALPLQEKEEISISTSGKSWRGYFSAGGELTNKKPDLKEGVNFGVEYSPNDPRVQAGFPLHGPNLWSSKVPELKPLLSEYMETLQKLGLAIMRGVSLSLNLPADYFQTKYLQSPSYRCITLSYPPDLEAAKGGEPRWGVGEHCDYGLLTILKQDNSGGLQVKSISNAWIDATPIENTFVCNIGDMLQTVTNGLYRSTPHRVRNIYTGKERFSCPFFLDPTWDSVIEPIPSTELRVRDTNSNKSAPKDGAKSYVGKYGEYATMKFSRSFPAKKETST